MEEKLHFTKDEHEILQELAVDERAKWEAKLDSFRMSPQHLMITLKGSEDEVKKVKQEIQKYLGKVVSNKSFSVKSPGALSSLGRSKIESLKSREKVLIQVDIANSPTYVQVSSVQQTVKHNGGIKIIVHQDKISKVSADAIVCPAEPHLKLHGEVGDYILEAGGLEIQEECTRYVARKGEVQPGQIYSSKAGNMLNCKHIFHAVVPDQNGSISDVMMNSLLKNCLEEAQKSQVTQMAIPLSFNYPVDKLIWALWKLVGEFISKCQTDVTLDEIRIVDMNARRLYQCMQKFKKITTKPKVKPKPNQKPIPAAAASSDLERRPFIYNGKAKTLSTVEGIKVEIFVGSITDVDPPVDVIVNSTSQNLALNQSEGTMSHAIYQRGGASLQEEVTRRAPDGLSQPAEVVNSEAPNIPSSRCVYHVALQSWDGHRNGNCVKVLRDTIKVTLTRTQTENHSSIAIPAIGSGVLKIPKDIVVDALFEELNAFSKENPRSSVKRVVFVAYDKDEKAVQKFTSKYAQLIKNTIKWTYNFTPQQYELLLNLHALSADSLDRAQDELNQLFLGSVTSEWIQNSSASPECLDKIDDDKARAIQCLQYTYRVRITLQKASDDLLESIQIEGFVDDVTKAKQDILNILAQ